ALLPHHAEEHRVSGTPMVELQPEHEVVAPETADLPAPSHEEEVETGQAFEAEAAAGVENAPEPDVAEVHVHGEEQVSQAAVPHEQGETPAAEPHEQGGDTEAQDQEEKKS